MKQPIIFDINKALPLIPIKHWALSFEFFEDMNSSSTIVHELKQQVRGQRRAQMQGLQCQGSDQFLPSWHYLDQSVQAE